MLADAMRRAIRVCAATVCAATVAATVLPQGPERGILIVEIGDPRTPAGQAIDTRNLSQENLAEGRNSA
jgi:hypothetical protein